MPDWGWIIAGGTALTGFLEVFWGYIKSLWSQLASRLIVTADLHGGLAEATGMYFWQNFHASRFGERTYLGCPMYVRPIKRVQTIAMEVIGAGGRLYWKGWRPIWISRHTGEKSNINISDNYYGSGIKLTFVRGTFDLDKLLTDATAQFNRRQAANDSLAQSRYRVVHFFGSANKPVNIGSEVRSGECAPSARSCSNWDPTDVMRHRVLQWQRNDLGTSRVNHGNALSQQALSPAAKGLVEEVKRWQTSEDWFKARGTPTRPTASHGVDR